MHEDDGKPNTKSAVPEIWGVLEGKQEGFSARAASDQPHHTRAMQTCIALPPEPFTLGGADKVRRSRPSDASTTLPELFLKSVQKPR